MTNQQDRIKHIGNSSCRLSEDDYSIIIPAIAAKEYDINEDDARALIRLISNLFKFAAIEAGYTKRQSEALMRKFRDAGRRSAPWKPVSAKVPDRPQDGSDGNRILRWLLPEDHKFFATEIIATLVEVKYYLQTLSMTDAPDTQHYGFSSVFNPWLLEHKVEPGQYIDPVQLIEISFVDFINQPRNVQSGHIFPLDRGGKHHPDNTFLMLFRSNQIQGNLTVEELLELMRTIIGKHDEAQRESSILEKKIRGS